MWVCVDTSGSLPKGHQINLRGHEMINGRGKKKKKLCYANLLSVFLDFISLLKRNVIILPLILLELWVW